MTSGRRTVVALALCAMAGCAHERIVMPPYQDMSSCRALPNVADDAIHVDDAAAALFPDERAALPGCKLEALPPLDDGRHDLEDATLLGECGALAQECRHPCFEVRRRQAAVVAWKRTLTGLRSFHGERFLDETAKCRPKPLPNQVEDDDVRALWRCMGLALPPKSVQLRFVFLVGQLEHEEQGHTALSMVQVGFNYTSATAELFEQPRHNLVLARCGPNDGWRIVDAP